MSAEREVVAVRTEPCPNDPETSHHIAVKLRDGTVETAEQVIETMDGPEHVHYVMRPPEGAPAYQAHQETGLLLELQTRPCPDCGKRVLFA